MKYGRLPRVHNPRIPHLSSLLTMRAVRRPSLPPACHVWDRLPADLGYMLNDRLGDCTAAGMGHAEQVWTGVAGGQVITVPDSAVEDAYEQACGYRPGDPSTDGGGVEQNVLSWWMNTGLLQPDGSRRQIAGFVEVDPRVPQDVCAAIYECGVGYIGFEVPRLLPEDGNGQLWSGASDLGAIEGGHCVIVLGWDGGIEAPVFDVISWGQRFRMDWEFWKRYVDEVYAPISPFWIEANGRSPWGLDLATIEAQMQALRTAA